MAKLTDKQEKFVQELLKGKSQREAYKAAYSIKKMSDKTIDENASRLFKNSKVSARYEELHDKIVKVAEDKCIVSVTEVLRELKTIGFANITDYLEVKELEVVTGYEKDEDGELDMSKPKIANYKTVDVFETARVHKDKLAAVAEIKQTKDGISIKMHDKVKALEDIARHLGMFNDKLTVTGDVVYQVKANPLLAPEE